MENRTQPCLRAILGTIIFSMGCEFTFHIPVTINGGGPDEYIESVPDGSVFAVSDASDSRLARVDDAGQLPADGALALDAGEDSRPYADAARSGDVADLGTVSGDARVRDGGAAGDAPTDYVAEVQSPSQCWGRRLATTNRFTQLALAGMNVWHICYHTALWDAIVPGADPRPARVSFLYFDPLAHFPIPFAEALAPSASNPWTANVMIALPPGQSFAPYFNLGNVREGGSIPDIIWAVQPYTPGGQLEQNGVIQVWRVNPDGTQTLSRPQMLCDDPLSSATESHAFFVPEAACAGRTVSVEACGLSGASCRLLVLP